MYANLKPFSLMGLPVASDKDLHAAKKCDSWDKQETLLPTTSTAEKSVFWAPSPMGLQCRGDDSEDGGQEDRRCTTPEAEDRGEVVLPKCPPPPRKPKSAPLKKRKAERVLLDLSNEIESMFPSNIVADLMYGKIKKVRTQLL